MKLRKKYILKATLLRNTFASMARTCTPHTDITIYSLQTVETIDLFFWVKYQDNNNYISYDSI